MTGCGIMLGCQGLESVRRHTDMDMGRAAGVTGRKIAFKLVHT